MSINLYTLGNMAAGVVDSATSEAAGFPKENMADFNPDTYWKPTNDNTVDIDIDLQTAKTVDAICLWVHNYNTAIYDVGEETSLVVKSSPDDDSYTTRYSYSWDLTVGSGPIFLRDFSGPFTYRYWRISVNDPLAVMHLSAIWLLRKYTLTVAHQYPNMDGYRFENRLSRAAGGRTFVAAVNSQMGYNLPRTYILGTTDYTALLAAWTDSAGTFRPLILNETTGGYQLVRFGSDELSKSEQTGSLYSPTVTFISEPYIPDGSTY